MHILQTVQRRDCPADSCTDCLHCWTLAVYCTACLLHCLFCDAYHPLPAIQCLTGIHHSNNQTSYGNAPLISFQCIHGLRKSRLYMHCYKFLEAVQTGPLYSTESFFLQCRQDLLAVHAWTFYSVENFCAVQTGTFYSVGRNFSQRRQELFTVQRGTFTMQAGTFHSEGKNF